MTLTWGIMSTSAWSNDFANVLNYLPKSEHLLIGIASSNKEKSAEFALKHNIPRVYESYEDLVKDEAIDVVYVGATNTSHYYLCHLVLSNGKHLLCEKPLTLKYEHTDILVTMAKKNKLFLMEAVWSRCFPLYDELSKLLASNAIGNVIYLQANFGIPITFKHKEKSGGTIFDLGVYVLQLAIFVFGRNPVQISAFGQINENGFDDSINYILKYKDGKIASLCTHSKVRLSNGATINGENGYIKIKDPFWAPTVISVNGGEENRFSLPPVEGKKFFTHSQGLVYEAEEVRKCIKNGLIESPKMPHEDTLLIAKWQQEISKLIGSNY